MIEPVLLFFAGAAFVDQRLLKLKLNDNLWKQTFMIKNTSLKMFELGVVLMYHGDPIANAIIATNIMAVGTPNDKE